MKIQELSNTELQEVNGGSILGSANDSSFQGGILGSLGIGNLLTYQSATKNGHQESATGLSVGNGITSSLGGLFGGSSSSIF